MAKVKKYRSPHIILFYERAMRHAVQKNANTRVINPSLSVAESGHQLNLLSAPLR
jgi:hypothetical protein